MHSRKNTIRAFLALMTLTVIWGYNWVVMKSALVYAGAFQFAALRTVIGTVCLFAVVILMRKPLRIKEIPTLILLGLLQTSGFTGLLIWALVEGGAGKTAVLTYTMPFWVMVLAWPLLGEKIRGLQWPAALLSTMGMLFILDPMHLGADTFSDCG
jgi:drug/metabolite transporter (DMT)-like permease